MPSALLRALPEGVAHSRYRYEVPFFDTDAMGIVHHANYVRYLELGRLHYLRERDQPYTTYVDQGMHVAVIGVQTAYYKPCRFADQLDIVCWLRWVRSVSLGFGYVIERDGEVVTAGNTDHAVVNDAGRPVRIPRQLRDRLAELTARP